MRVALLGMAVLLAGCGGLGLGGGPATPSPSPAPVPTAESPFPPGVVAGGVTDATALAAAHRANVRNRSYTLVVFERERAGAPALGAYFVGTRRVVRVARDGTYSVRVFRVNTRGGGALTTESLQRERYGNDTVGYVRNVSRDGPVYRRATGRTDFAALGSGYVTRYLAVENASARPRRNGSVRIRGSDPTALPGVSSYSVDADVDPDGTVRRLHAEFVDREGEVRFVTVRYLDVGTTRVTRPDWVGEARAAANASNATG